MITEHTARLGEVQLTDAQAKFKPFLHIDTAVRSILATAQAEMNPTPGVHIPMRLVLSRCREPIARVAKDIAITGLDLNTQISAQIKVGAKDEVKRLDQKRTHLALGVLVAEAKGAPLRDHAKVVIYGDTSKLHVGSTNLVDIDLPHPTKPDGKVCLGTSIGALTSAVHHTTGLNAAASGKIVVFDVLKKLRFETQPETGAERIIRLALEFNALTLALRDENRVLDHTPQHTKESYELIGIIAYLQNIRADQIKEINNTFHNNPFKDVLKVSRERTETHIIFTVSYTQGRGDVVIRIPKRRFKTMIDQAPN